MDTRLLEAAANECRASLRASTKACNRVWRTVSEWYKPDGNQTAHVVRGKVMLSIATLDKHLCVASSRFPSFKHVGSSPNSSAVRKSLVPAAIDSDEWLT